MGITAAACQSNSTETSNAAANTSNASVSAAAASALDPARMRRVGEIDERYQSYNVEMLEVTGGKFWRPYSAELRAIIEEGKSAAAPPPTASGDTPAGMDPRLYQYRPPLDLTNARLRKLAGALAPAFVRVSGTWANTTYLPAANETATAPPPGFMGVLTREQWKGLVDFSKAANAGIVTSMATGTGTRDAAGVWTTDQAKRLFDYTKSLGGQIAAAEFMNEPTLAAMGGAPAGYDAAAYGRDFQIFHRFAKQNAPEMIVLGPGSVGETTGDWGVTYGIAGTLATRDLLAASKPALVDAFSYHHYGGGSIRCAKATTPDEALSEQWLRRTDETLAFYRPLRDEFAPGKSFWNTETAETACGGNPWAATFLDTFRYLDQLGRLAKQEVRVVAHNTLAASDYSILDETTFAPKPSYWGALLWRKLMGTTVLEAGVPIQPGRHVYAHCLRGAPGGVALLIINNDRAAAQTLDIPVAAERYTLSAPTDDLQTKNVLLNGEALELGANDALPDLKSVPTPAGSVRFAPATITFLALPEAENAACR